MSWLYSQALVEEYLGDISLDGEQSVQSSGSNTQQAYCALDKMTGFSRLSRFGMTYKPLTESRGEELLKLYLGAFHVRTFQPQEKALESQENDQECGDIWQGLLAKYNPNTHSWKTAQCSLFEDLEQSLETWPRWGLMRDGECWEQQTLERHIKGTEFGLSQKYPTPTAYDGRRGTMKEWKPIRPSGHPAQYPLNQALRDLTQIVGKPNPIFVEWLMGWPIRWTDLKRLEMDKYHSVQPPLGNYLHKETNDSTLD